eukprot:TRINITY_DN70083_c0_g1_i1.p1 TRINITY_DN70083_c0_g1~~TRINITY_DN70083_c0_g1_i1.p1  ORF type:complete len:536 (+),score=143.65 TRINITY_DN70083_c0_g1_i1:99-1706(+)
MTQKLPADPGGGDALPERAAVASPPPPQPPLSPPGAGATAVLLAQDPSAADQDAGSPHPTAPSTEAAEEAPLGLCSVLVLLMPIYASQFLMAASTRAATPVIPVVVKGMGGSEAVIAVVLAMPGLGRMVANVPAGQFVQARGNRFAMVAALALQAVARALQGLCPNVPLLILCRAAEGVGDSTYLIARLAFAGAAAPKAVRGRAMSMLGGCTRWGAVLGPVMGGVLSRYASPSVSFLAQGALAALAAGVVLARIPATVPDAPPPHRHHHPPAPQRSTWALFRAFLPAFAAVGVFVFCLQGLRESRLLLFVLKGDALELSEDQVGYVISIAFFVESLMFPVSGVLMDRWGRKASGVPSCLIMVVALILLPAARSFGSLALVGMLASVGNALSSGLVMVIGSDLAPHHARGEFLGLYRLFTDSALLLAPVIAGALVSAFSLRWGAWAVACMGIAGAGWMLLCISDTGHQMHQADPQDAAPDDDVGADASSSSSSSGVELLAVRGGAEECSDPAPQRADLAEEASGSLPPPPALAGDV